MSGDTDMASSRMGTETRNQRIADLAQMQLASDAFYTTAIRVGVHPFIEFTGLMNEYIKVCRRALENGIDFGACNRHTGRPLPMESHEVMYINEKLECIFTGRSVMSEPESPTTTLDGTEQSK